ncbi:MAG: 3-hydroxybutyrate dehydrogenase [Candidatus Obscuribacterales bacterium]|nr:3-hydroxybutyrate dehydrogenase [Candidatus Obscuribacterales bacterium]
MTSLKTQAKVAVITGATSGIGKAIAKAMAEKHLCLAINGFGSEAEIAGVIKELKEAGAKDVVHLPTDMSRTTEVEHFIESAIEKFGGVDVLVNNAGIQHTALVEDFPVDRWDQIIAINLSAAFHTIRMSLPKMKAKNWGRIINIASVHGLVASTHKAAYVAAKHGIVGLTKVVALECADTGITCNAVCPGWVETPLVEKQVEAIAAANDITVDEARHRLISEKQPSNRFVSLEELGALCLYLASDLAGSITGSSMPIDGGWTAR